MEENARNLLDFLGKSAIVNRRVRKIMNLKNVFTDWKRNILILADIFSIIFTFYLAFLLRFMDEIPFFRYFPIFYQTVLLVTISYIISFLFFGLYRGLYRYAGINDLLRLSKAVIGGAFLSVVGVIFILDLRSFPRSIFIIHLLLVFVFVGGIRLFLRVFREELAIRLPNKSKRFKRILLVGAGDTGETILRETKKHPNNGYKVVGFVDDNLNKIGRDIHGVKVLGAIDDISEIVKKKNIDEIIITVPSATREQMRRIIEVCSETHLSFRTTPSLSDIIDGQVSFSQIRNVEVKDLLSREVVKLDLSKISSYISGKRILVTGAGGSIGSEICRQLTRFNPDLLIFFARGEFSLYKIIKEFGEKYPSIKIAPVIADVRDRERTRAVLSKYRPQVIFHTAAHKHVSLMETNPCEAVKNNVMGTRIIMETAEEFGVERFVLISTDKAVNPTSFMGASKRITELLLQAMTNKKSNFTKFSAVRFGNVLESRGSVVPLFKEQIKKGRAVTVTHPEVARYFMTLSEAAQLVIQAGAIGKGGEIFVLDMGEQVKIIDLARDLIRLLGFEPDVDIRIKIIGLRPGEKLHEELIGKDEKVQPTSHEKIMSIKSNKINAEELRKKVEELEKLAVNEDVEEVRKKIKEIVPEFKNTHKL